MTKHEMVLLLNVAYNVFSPQRHFAKATKTQTDELITFVAERLVWLFIANIKRWFSLNNVQEAKRQTKQEFIQNQI